MKLTLCFLFLVTLYFLLSVDAQDSSKKLEAQRMSPSTRRPNEITTTRRRFVNRGRNSRRKQRLRSASRIVCSFAKTGKWPTYPQRLRRFVLTQSRVILTMADENMKEYCRRFNIIITSTRRPITVRPTNFQRTTTSRFLPPFIYTTTMPSTTLGTLSTATFTPSTTIFTTTPSTTITTPATTTSRTALFPIVTFPVNTVASTSTTTPQTTTTLRTALFPIVTIGAATTSTTTTTTQKPISSASGSSYYYSGSGSAYYSGSGSAYTATGSLTSKASDQSSKLIQPANDVAMRSFKAKNGDIIIKWTPGAPKLKKISL